MPLHTHINRVSPKISPARVICGSLIALIILGTGLLSLPNARINHYPLVDLLLMAISSVCVTGLDVIPLDGFTSFGQAVILALIQVGALGMVTLSVFLISCFFELRLTTQLMTGEMLETEQWQQISEFLGFILGFTFLIELLGTLVTYFLLPANYPGPRLAHSLFHAVSAMSSAGISLVWPYAKAQSLTGIWLVTTVLMFIGGMGFSLWRESYRAIQYRLQGRKNFHWSLTSRVICSASLIIIMSATATWFVLAPTAGSWWPRIVGALCNSVGMRSTGFVLFDPTQLHPAGSYLIMLIALIGSAPGSTGGGIKVTTIVICIAIIRTVIGRRTDIEIKNRTVPLDIVHKAAAILFMTIISLSSALLIMLIAEPSFTSGALMFETISSYANLGLSTGVVHKLTPLSKLVLGICMIVGRLGPLTLIMAVRKKHEREEFHYPEERIMLS